MLSCSTCGIRFSERPVAEPVLSSIKDQSTGQPQYDLSILTLPKENLQFEKYSLTNEGFACFANSLFTVLASTPAFYNSLNSLFFGQEYKEWQEKLSFVQTDIINMHTLQNHYVLTVLNVGDKFNYINENISKNNGEVFSSKKSSDWIYLYNTIQKLFNEAVDAVTPQNPFRLPGIHQSFDDPESFDIGGDAEELLYIHVFGLPTEFSTRTTIFKLTGASTTNELLNFTTKNGKRYKGYAIIGYVGGHYNCVVQNSKKEWRFFDNQQTQLLEFPYTYYVGTKGTKERIPGDLTLTGYIKSNIFLQAGIFYRRVDD